MKTVENNRIRVEVEDEYYAENSRCEILSDAMRALGHRSEAHLLADEPLRIAEATKNIYHDYVVEYLRDHPRYDLGNTLMRMTHGAQMSIGMEGWVDAAKMYADRKINITLYPEIQEKIRVEAQNIKNGDLEYSQRFQFPGLKITILDPKNMPAQIGMSRYQQQN